MGRRICILLFVFLFGASTTVFAQSGDPSWGVYQVTENTTTPLLTNRPERVRPIASITKLMTGWITLTSQPTLSQLVTITTQDTRDASTTVLRSRDRVSIETLIYLMLVSSDNVAARALARTVEGTRDAFVARMNRTAEQLYMVDTHYADPAGLLAGNVSTVTDIIRLLGAVTSTPLLSDAFHTQTYTATIQRNTRTHRLTVRNTNRLLDDSMHISKTGFTSAAGYCLVQWITAPERSYVTVVLGAPSKDYRLGLMQALMQFIQPRY